LQQSSVGATPACVLLDVKLTDKSGFEVLSWIRSQPHFKQLPVVLLSSSNHPEDVSRAYEHGANSYLVKPHDLHSLVEMAKTIDLYWVRTNTSNAV
jgi:DNA-binding response OmpR family regulator